MWSKFKTSTSVGRIDNQKSIYTIIELKNNKEKAICTLIDTVVLEGQIFFFDLAERWKVKPNKKSLVQDIATSSWKELSYKKVSVTDIIKSIKDGSAYILDFRDELT